MSTGFDSENCSDFTADELKQLNLVISISAMICILIILVVLVLLIAFKRAFFSTFQRLYFCLMVETLIAEIAFALSIERHFSYKYHKEVCIGVGFLINWSDIMVYISSYEIIFYLLYLVISRIKGNPWKSSCTKSKFIQGMLEALYAFLPIILPLPYVLPPYFNGHYGSAGAWCWIRSVDDNCKPIGALDQVLAYSTNEAVGLVGMIVCVIFTIVYCKLASHLKETRHLLKRTIFLMCFQIGQILIVTIPFAIRVYAITAHSYQNYGLWFLKALLEPFSKLITQVGCFVCFYPAKHMLCFAFNKVTTGKKSKLSRMATVQISSRISPPSSTFFDIPHSEESECSSLLKQGINCDTSYQSTKSSSFYHQYFAKLLQ